MRLEKLSDILYNSDSQVQDKKEPKLKTLLSTAEASLKKLEEYIIGTYMEGYFK